LLGLVASVIFNIIGLYTLNYIFKNLKAYVAGNILLLEGVFAIIIGFLFYNERLNIEEIIGALLIVFCAYMISRLSLKQQKVIGADI
jgi:drug/metabolite transporter (DMT)-like permease